MNVILKSTGYIVGGLAVFNIIFAVLGVNQQIAYDIVMYFYPTLMLTILNRNLNRKMRLSTLLLVNFSVILSASLVIGLVIGTLTVINTANSDFFRVENLGYGAVTGSVAFFSSLIWLVVDAIVAIIFSRWLIGRFTFNNKP